MSPWTTASAPFLVFSGQKFYPRPAWEDLRGICATLEEAEALVVLCEAYGFYWYQIVAVSTFTVVSSDSFVGPEIRDDSWVFTPHTPEQEQWLAFLARSRKEEPSHG